MRKYDYWNSHFPTRKLFGILCSKCRKLYTWAELRENENLRQFVRVSKKGNFHLYCGVYCLKKQDAEFNHYKQKYIKYKKLADRYLAQLKMRGYGES